MSAAVATKKPPRRLNLSVQYACDADGLPSRDEIRAWCRAAIPGAAQVTVRFVDADEGRELNRDYRGKDYATNVLTFAYDEGDGMPLPEGLPLMGDLVLCVPVVAREAAEQDKPLPAHYAHLIVHGMLHLQGFDHESDDEAEEMEARERELLAGFGIPDPYARDAR